jgi:hypothetical protein
VDALSKAGIENGYDFADINLAAADATSGAAIKPVLPLSQ